MSDQLTLDLSAAARRTDPVTSHEAARVAAVSAESNRAKALAALRRAGAEGLTDFELERITGVKQTSIGKRRGELRDMGLVEPLLVGGKPQRRPAPSGAPALVWVAVKEVQS